MAGKKQSDWEPEMVIEESTPATEAPRDYVRVVNLSTTGQIQIPLRDGTSVSLGPRLPGKQIHVSAPILKKNVGEAVRNMAKRKQIALEEVQGGAQ